MRNKKEVSYSLQLMIQLQKLSYKERQSGYALLMASVMSILIFSMLTVYIFSSRVSKSTANAMVDAGSTFYAAEAGLNNRAHEMRSRVGNFSRPTGVPPTDTSPAGSPLGTRVASMMASCLGPNAAQKGSGDFACTESYNNYAESTMSGADGQVSMERRTNAAIKYRTYSFVQDLTPAVVALTVIPANNDFAGLRATDYQYRVYSTALKKADNSANISAQAMLQMQFIDRFIPIFQFAAFYQGDLEITSSPDMSINGPIHSNAGIYLAPGNLLTLNGNVSHVGGIFRSLRYKANSTVGVRSVSFTGGGPYPDNAVDCNSVTNGCVNVAGAWGAGPFPLAISPASIAASNAIRNTGILRLPPSGFLSQQQANGNPGTYYNKADLRVTFDPRNANPTFNITRMEQSNSTPAVIENFSVGLINSLQKPVMLRVTNDAARSFSEIVRLCPKLDGTPGEPNPADPVVTKRAIPALPTTLTSPTGLAKLNNPINGLVNRQAVVDALRQAIIMMPMNPPTAAITYAQTKSAASGTLLINFQTTLTNAGFTAAERTTITGAKLNEIAALNTNSLAGGGGDGGCFLPAPMQILSPTTPLASPLLDKREGRNMYILQSNIKSLTAWNRDGVYGDGTASGAQLPAANKLFTRKLSTTLAAVDQLPANDLLNTSNVAGANCDYDCLGLGSVDGVRSSTAVATTQGGLVWHYSLVNRAGTYNYISNPSDADASPPVVATRNATKGVSPYGFAFSGAARLPGALTVASDQAIYIQGDYNNPSSFPGTIPAVTTPPTLDLLDTPAIGLNRTATTNPAAKEKRPAAILADSAIMLSNNCSDDSFRLSCLRTFTATSAGGAGTQMPPATTTVVRAAILAGTEATNVATGERSGGLNNHLSFRENWNGRTIKYRGSLVSKGIPSEFNGLFLAGCDATCTGGLQHINTYFSPPLRDFGFDTDFNSVDGLPPLTPNVNLLIQKVYKRDYDSQNRG